MNDVLHTESLTVTQEGPPLHSIDERTRIDYYRQFNDLNRADPKIKNIRQTELLVNLRQAILAVSCCTDIISMKTAIEITLSLN